MKGPEKPLLIVYAEREQTHGGRSLGRAYLVNRLNLLNFRGEPILLCFRTQTEELLLRGNPAPCAGDTLELLCEKAVREVAATHRLDLLLVPDGTGFLAAAAHIEALDGNRLSLKLPERCRILAGRTRPRERGVSIEAHLTQEGVLFSGRLLDFGADALRVAGNAVPAPAFLLVNPREPMHLRLFDSRNLLFSGECALVRQGEGAGERTLVLRPLKARVARFPPAPHRDPRLKLVPSPSLSAFHPLSRKSVTLPVLEVSGTGFSVRERLSSSPLLPGLVFPSLSLVVAEGLEIVCRAQVVSREETAGESRCAFAILDLAPSEQVKLLSLVQHAGEERTFLCGRIDPDLLWELLFETGFVYPKKYLLLAGQKEQVQRTYARLYGSTPEIARHFTFQDRGGLLGHLAMLRWYRDAWMIQHHAARKSLTLRAGLSVLQQAARYVNALHLIPSAHLRFVLCYFRPDNSLPNRLFGGVARHLDDQSRCSLDRFAYGRFASPSHPAPVPEGWALSRATAADLARFRNFYRSVSGGLFPVACDLEQAGDVDELARIYRRCGFFRKRRIYALKQGENLAALLLADRSDAALNLSELTDCVTLFILGDLPAGAVEGALSRLSRRYRGHAMPVLVYPNRCAQGLPLSDLKEYHLWILDLRYGDEYLAFFERLVPGRKKPDRAESPWEAHP